MLVPHHPASKDGIIIMSSKARIIRESSPFAYEVTSYPRSRDSARTSGRST